jgi:asparagine synthase (glutamine-hydrolysing)
MCGIAGIIGVSGGVSRQIINDMRDTLAHRGPDGSGTMLFDHSGRPLTKDEPAIAGLAHRRLSIIDLSPAGSQPMSNEDGTVWISYNGEFYNFKEYQKELEQKGHVFRSHSDTETIVHLYEEYGIEETLRRMNGMFAFGIWDTVKKTLVMARDRIGKKPIYYAEVNGGIVFASEMKAIYASGLINPERLDDVALAQAMVIGTPLRERTMFEQIRMLLPGNYAVWQDGRLQIRSYYTNPFEVNEPEEKPLDDWADELDALLVDATRIRLVSDVPVGLFLSGGVDSSLIAAITAKELKVPLQTYCISFADKIYDESEHARNVALHLKLPIHIMPAVFHGSELFERIATHIDQPLGDASAIPTFLVSESARLAGVKVALTGDGGDELFAGYENYRNGLKFWGTHAQRKMIRQKRTLPELIWEARVRARGFERGYMNLQNQFGFRHRMLAYKSCLRAVRDQRSAGRERLDILRKLPDRPILDRMQFSDMQTLMVDVVLRKVDLMSMANGLECRSPLLDYRILELASRLTFKEKFDAHSKGKMLLRHVLARYIPRELFERPKMGFCIPWDRYVNESFSNDLKRRWRTLDMPHLKPDVGDWLFEETGAGSMFRMWSAFTHLVFFEKHRRMMT